MSLLKTLFGSRPSTASVAKDRLQLIIARERSDHAAIDWLPRLQKDLLEVIARYVPVEPDAVKVEMERSDNLELLEINIALPDPGTSRTPSSAGR
ncbi:cell division topological specificity factor MinE [Caldimonas tepidiphila]|uniref:cell division topological specificity factor MinE n=1 Tax=Caldimonas tepidiphila TaxID=2315841 RepID=UPI000E5B1209|nr:cell division topological specificity factor MinE [Caldimonas tepidiphila]